MRILIALMLLFSSTLLAQNNFELKGSFPAPGFNRPAEFTINFTEENGKLNGEYKDNVYSKKNKIIGAVGDNSRIFRIPFENDPKGVGSITIITSQEKTDTLPMSVVVQNAKGTPLSTSYGDARLTLKAPPAPVRTAQSQQEPGCQEGFGLLAGFCGAYEGMVTEEDDDKNRCSLNENMNPRLIMNENAEVFLTFGPASETVEMPSHQIGRAPNNSTTSSIDVMSRECRPLTGTRFPGDNCKRINIRGDFSEGENTDYFTGDYFITDENTNERCQYRFAFNKVPEITEREQDR